MSLHGARAWILLSANQSNFDKQLKWLPVQVPCCQSSSYSGIADVHVIAERNRCSLVSLTTCVYLSNMITGYDVCHVTIYRAPII